MTLGRLINVVKEHVWGPVGSVFFHVAILILLIRFAVTPEVEKTVDIQPVVIEPHAQKLEEIDKAIKDEFEKMDKVVDLTPVTPPPDAPVFSDVTPDVPAANPGVGAGAAGSGPGAGPGAGEGDMGGLDLSMDVHGPLTMKGLYANRSAGGRAGAIRAYKGTTAGEDAVMRALRWLKKQQQANGSWAGEPAAMTGFALLAFLAHGETPASEEFGPTVEKAIKFLISQQNAKGMFSADPYAHAIATYATCEAFALTKIMPVRDAMEKALQIVIDGQQVRGGFDYHYAKNERFDTSVTGWQVQALKSGRMAGARNAGLEKAIQKVATFLKNDAFDPAKGMFRYSNKSAGSWTMTGVGCLGLQMLGYSKAVEVRAGLAALDQTAAANVAWVKGTNAENKVYGWYYVTQAKFQDGGDRWDMWNRTFARELISAQSPDGHWDGGDYQARCGMAYTTALCALMLEVYYRYLPTYQKMEDAAPVKATSDDDVVIDVS